MKFAKRTHSQLEPSGFVRMIFDHALADIKKKKEKSFRLKVFFSPLLKCENVCFLHHMVAN